MDTPKKKHKTMLSYYLSIVAILITKCSTRAPVWRNYVGSSDDSLLCFYINSDVRYRREEINLETNVEDEPFDKYVTADLSEVYCLKKHCYPNLIGFVSGSRYIRKIEKDKEYIEADIYSVRGIVISRFSKDYGLNRPGKCEKKCNLTSIPYNECIGARSPAYHNKNSSFVVLSKEDGEIFKRDESHCSGSYLRDISNKDCNEISRLNNTFNTIELFYNSEFYEGLFYSTLYNYIPDYYDDKYHTPSCVYTHDSKYTYPGTYFGDTIEGIEHIGRNDATRNHDIFCMKKLCNIELPRGTDVVTKRLEAELYSGGFSGHYELGAVRSTDIKNGDTFTCASGTEIKCHVIMFENFEIVKDENDNLLINANTSCYDRKEDVWVSWFFLLDGGKKHINSTNHTTIVHPCSLGKCANEDEVYQEISLSAVEGYPEKEDYEMTVYYNWVPDLETYNKKSYELTCLENFSMRYATKYGLTRKGEYFCFRKGCDVVSDEKYFVLMNKKIIRKLNDWDIINCDDTCSVFISEESTKYKENKTIEVKTSCIGRKDDVVFMELNATGSYNELSEFEILHIDRHDCSHNGCINDEFYSVFRLDLPRDDYIKDDSKIIVKYVKKDEFSKVKKGDSSYYDLTCMYNTFDESPYQKSPYCYNHYHHRNDGGPILIKSKILHGLEYFGRNDESRYYRTSCLRRGCDILPFYGDRPRYDKYIFNGGNTHKIKLIPVTNMYDLITIKCEDTCKNIVFETVKSGFSDKKNIFAQTSCYSNNLTLDISWFKNGDRFYPNISSEEIINCSRVECPSKDYYYVIQKTDIVGVRSVNYSITVSTRKKINKERTSNNKTITVSSSSNNNNNASSRVSLSGVVIFVFSAVGIFFVLVILAYISSYVFNRSRIATISRRNIKYSESPAENPPQDNDDTERIEYPL